MSLSNISFIKKLSLVLSRKAYLIYTDNPIPSLLIPLPSIDKTIKSAIYKTFSDLTNDQILTFHSKAIAEKDLNNIQRQHKAHLNVEDVHFPNQTAFESIENIQIKPDSLFLTVNQEDQSLSFMQYQDLQNTTLMAKSKSGETVQKGEKPKEEKNKKEEMKKQQKKMEVKKKNGQKDDKNVKGTEKKKQTVEQGEEEFKDENAFERKQMSQWNEQAPQLSTKPEDQPKEDISSLRTNKFIPLAILTDNIATKPIQIIHIQTSRQYLLLKLLKVFCIANILCVYGLIHNASRSENHNEIKGGQ